MTRSLRLRLGSGALQLPNVGAGDETHATVAGWAACRANDSDIWSYGSLVQRLNPTLTEHRNQERA